jgi:hypothetical protein
VAKNNLERYTALIGDGESTDISVVHGLNDYHTYVQVLTLDHVDISAFVGWGILSENEIMLFFQKPPAKDSLRLNILKGFRV